MVDQSRNLLDELFGKDRNLHPQSKDKGRPTYNDDNVCKYFLISQCYHDLFPNTQYDDGPCVLDHDQHFKRQFEDDELQRRLKNQKKYISTATKYIEDQLVEVDAKIRKNKAHLQSKTFSQFQRPKEIADQISSMENDIKRLLQESRTQGEEGKIEQSEKLAQQAELMLQQKQKLIQLYENPQGSLREQSVCQVCGALQTTSENDKRTQSHLDGKIHKGFALIRDDLVRLKVRKEEIRKIEDQQQSRKKSKSRSKDQSKHSKKHQSRSRERKSQHDKHDSHQQKKQYHHQSKQRSKSHSSSSSD